MDRAARFRLSFPSPGWSAIAVFVLVIVWFGAEFFVSVWTPYQQEQQIIKKAETFGVRFLTEKGGPEWLRRVVGDKPMRVFDRVNDAFSPHSFIPEDCLADLSRLENLKSLDLSGSRLSDDVIATLREMKKLEKLNLYETFVTDTQLESLKAALPQCEILHE